MSIHDRVPVPQEGLNFPKPGDVVLGGTPPQSAAVLGGQGAWLATLVEQFDANAKRCNKHYSEWHISSRVKLVSKTKRDYLDPLVVKVLIFDPYCWEFAGYLKHDGPLFGHRGRYDTNASALPRELYAIAYEALITKGKENVQGNR
jgi:hypothetical protein